MVSNVKETLKKLKRPVFDMLVALFFTILFISLLTFEMVRIEGNSMEPTFYHGDIIFALKTNNVDAGQFAVLDGEMSQKANFTVTLAENEYLVLGDHRNDSLDSRIFGPVSKKRLKAGTLFHLLSLAQ